MSEAADLISGRGERPWMRFLLLLFLFFAGGLIASLLPTPGSWSDVRSQWLPLAVMTVINFCLLIAIFWIYRRAGPVFKVQAVILWLIIGSALIACLYGLYDSFAFLRQVRLP